MLERRERLRTLSCWFCDTNLSFYIRRSRKASRELCKSNKSRSMTLTPSRPRTEQWKYNPTSPSPSVPRLNDNFCEISSRTPPDTSLFAWQTRRSKAAETEKQTRGPPVTPWPIRAPCIHLFGAWRSIEFRETPESAGRGDGGGRRRRKGKPVATGASSSAAFPSEILISYGQFACLNLKYALRSRFFFSSSRSPRG